MAVLDSIREPHDLRTLGRDALRELAAEIRRLLIDRVSRTGGHLGPNLGVVELTLGVHRVFDSPRDRILFDTGHQAYVHKILTGRAGQLDGLRRKDGLSGYPSRAESPHDIIENSHASTALSYADGLAKAYRLRGEVDRHVVAVVGDGALTGGMSWEALNNIAAARSPNVVVVLNDNGRSYAPTVGGLAEHLTALRAGSTGGAAAFEQLGLRYLGPVDGHDLDAVQQVLRQARDLPEPVVVHCVTRKGAGYPAAEQDEADQFHSVGVIDPATGRPLAGAGGRSWTSVFAEEMVQVGADRADVVAVTAAMLQPVGLDAFAAAHPGRVFDVGIAEQHAVTSAVGLSLGGLHPVVAIYATFLNRAFDQVLMDAALHRTPMTLVLDRAGITGNDGPSHHGMWDLSLLQLMPGLRVAAPRDAATLRAELREALDVTDAPTALRFPKGTVPADIPAVGRCGTADVLTRGTDPDVLILGVGAMAPVAVRTAELLAGRGIDATVLDPRWVTPLDPAVVALAARYHLVVTVEDNSRCGGVGSVLAQELRDAGVHTPLRNFGIPRRFLAHAARAEVLTDIGLDADQLAAAVADTYTATFTWQGV
ncbi:1-deoxy-D-xylulose-5-phosphate synthase [Dactylosporangium siamense]|uniref:1-deoxy-D-xylulose-5-phosphate synthase n=1 Tax=Dactylosporangium siamense TaxID=685454 RepID=A0A919U8B7_9ACTN|nr:1-deoxy-D-xylulose-5-phosphate synthase [Dactylosporangium siamense]GIG42610.1 1-deoxy-D-xylulose-5-phosphate synthase [Dactylosporangium siamense]